MYAVVRSTNIQCAYEVSVPDETRTLLSFRMGESEAVRSRFNAFRKLLFRACLCHVRVGTYVRVHLDVLKSTS